MNATIALLGLGYNVAALLRSNANIMIFLILAFGMVQSQIAKYLDGGPMH